MTACFSSDYMLWTVTNLKISNVTKKIFFYHCECAEN